MNVVNCENGCCTLKWVEYSAPKKEFFCTGRGRNKAGVFIYDPKEDKVLIVQSRGNLWGSAKGTFNEGETEIECAIREVKEETGLDVKLENFTRVLTIGNTSTYFYMEMNMCEVNVQTHIIGNDVNGIGWIKPDCLIKCMENGNVVLNQHFCIIFSKFLLKPISKSSIDIYRENSK